jgi:ubiquinone/menaquinone biosynthesis C-methylase UbiE
LDGPRILELGHGPGHLQLALLAKGCQVFGLDESRQMGLLAVKRMKKGSLSFGLVNGYAQFAPFASGSFDQVLATFPSEYIYAPHTAQEIYRLLVPGGSAVILPIAWITSSHWIYRLAAWLFRTTGQAPANKDSLPLVEFTSPYEEAGFEVVVKDIILETSQLVILQAFKPVNSTLLN